MADLNDLFNEQQFCLRWNNFQANITSQFDALRSNEDFTDVTIACDGQRLSAHKVVLSACSPYFKDLFKSNPCQHPIIFMKDVEARHIISLMEFMYVGEVNVSQTHLSAFLKTAESLKVRGLTDTSSSSGFDNDIEENSLLMKPYAVSKSSRNLFNKPKNTKISSTITSSQDAPMDNNIINNFTMPKVSSPLLPKRISSNSNNRNVETEIRLRNDENMINPFALQNESRNINNSIELNPKVELPDYISDDDRDDFYCDKNENNNTRNNNADLIIDKVSREKDLIEEEEEIHSPKGFRMKRRRISDHWNPYNAHTLEAFWNLSRLSEKREPDRRNKLIQLGEGVEICEDQLHSIKWNDYRKLTRGLATILFSPAELATCSVTGQRWSRAGNGERPVKPALDRAKVQAIISYVAGRFPMIEISRIKQVLAYKCKENSTAFKMKAVRYYGNE